MAFRNIYTLFNRRKMCDECRLSLNGIIDTFLRKYMIDFLNDKKLTRCPF